MRSGTVNVRIQFVPLTNTIRNEVVLEIFRFARKRIKVSSAALC